ncbi:hypothetical protein Slin15195_G042170 [Septoria linicola]|uniref:Bacteriophage T5 Orf172 DNA-binding domain-containing protein n=1 Tax=Septoria linicola TaxID=215465 RepID=A0A9Q9EJ16_9PEZI|nr:hypothetical protein Slin14017_G045680 [Septoria linicola]USW50898.1 hypothetical protein Slin15195_G042170 [Septoria linicola]
MANQFTNTPEALLGRNDSKNPSTTCKGITSSGRPCRRALAAAKTSPSGSRRGSASGVVAVVEENGAVMDAEFFCWQHKDQAQATPQDSPSKRTKKQRTTELYPLQERSSIDTLVQKLGIDAVPENIRRKARTRPNDGVKPPKRTSTTDFANVRLDAQRPSNDLQYNEKYDSRPPPRQDSRQKKQGFWASLCCGSSSQDDDYVEIIRHKKRVEQRPQSQPNVQSSNTSLPRPERRSSSQLPSRKSEISSTTHKQRSSSNPQTGRLLSLIPQDLSPQTTSTLLAELIKPISQADEDGYIYIFWLTPQSKAAPTESTARSLLSAPSDRPQASRRISDVMTEFSFDGNQESTRGPSSDQSRKTIMLKIGRANNVTRRMNEWQRQCGYALNLVRWYPYVSGTPATSPAHSPPRPSISGYPDLSSSSSSRANSGTVHKVPFVKRVERLIHLELADQQVKKQCEACGKEHREWFEVEPSEQGVRRVDACVKRWVAWAENELTA